MNIKNKKLKVIEIGGAYKHATNNQMELTASVKALEYLKENLFKEDLGKDLKIEIFSDSKYVILGITEWIHNWIKNNWRNTAKKPVLNCELWKNLYELAKEFQIKWNYVEGHSGDKYNDRADEIATFYADKNKIK